MVEWSEILGSVQAVLTGEPVEGRRLMLVCWDRTGPQDAAQRCVLAHYLADLEPEVAEEVRWDERALAAYAAVAEDELAPIGIPSARAMAPSLHLNLGDGYLRLGRPGEAQSQLSAGLAAAGLLDDDGYGALIRQGLDRLAQRLAESVSADTTG
jgi:hypothetical protein